MTPQTWLVVALGNPRQGADGFGPAVAARLRGARSLPEGVDLADARTDLLAWIDRFAQYDRVVLVDAVLGGEPGRVAVFGEEVFGQWDEASPGAHSLSPLVAVKLFRQLHPGASTTITLIARCVDELRVEAGVPEDAVTMGAQAVTCLIDRAAGRRIRNM
jgi:hydrogenase maturation protease